MNIYGPEGDSIIKLLFIGVALGLLTERTLHIAAIKSSGSSMHLNPDRLNRFVGNDWTIFITTLLCSAGALVPVLVKHGPHDLITFLKAAMHVIPLFGYPLTIVVLMHLVSPLVVAFLLQRGRKRRNPLWREYRKAGLHY
ncbi:MAG: hypothetical protein QFB86_04600 [Patescibacteria group bacterium]|nr:hypothetical protein [Patescibacteria group bacterium]